MTTIKEMAEQYEATSTKCITELETVPIDLKVVEVERGQGENAFKMLITELNGEEYKVPKSVLKQLKEILSVNPKVASVKVTKTGQGLNTTYTTIPL